MRGLSAGVSRSLLAPHGARKCRPDNSTRGTSNNDAVKPLPAAFPRCVVVLSPGAVRSGKRARGRSVTGCLSGMRNAR
jgi:hypothetical protein